MEQTRPKLGELEPHQCKELPDWLYFSTNTLNEMILNTNDKSHWKICVTVGFCPFCGEKFPEPYDSTDLLNPEINPPVHHKLMYEWQQPVANEMKERGGSFVKALGESLAHADINNAEKIRKNWPEIWEEYLNYAKETENRVLTEKEDEFLRP